MTRPLQLHDSHIRLPQPPKEHLTNPSRRPAILHRLRQQHRTHIKFLRLHHGPIARLRAQEPHGVPPPRRRVIQLEHPQGVRVVAQRAHPADEPHGHGDAAEQRHGGLEASQGHADTGHEEVAARLVAGALVGEVHEGHADDAFHLLVERGDVVGEHAAGAQAVEGDGSRVVRELVVDEVAAELHPVVVGVGEGRVGFGLAVARHVQRGNLEAGFVEGPAEDHGHLAGVGADAVEEDEADLRGRVAPAVDVDGVASDLP